MTMPDLPTPDEIRMRFAEALAAHWKLFLVQGIILIILGLLAVAMPLAGTFAVELLVGWLFFIGGIVRTLALLGNKHQPGFWWSLLGAFLASALGLVLIANPFQGVITLTMVMMALFLAEGVSAIFAALHFREHSKSWGWLLLTGLVDLFLVYLLWQGWPGTVAWAIGLLAGVNLFFTGLSLVMLSVAARPTK